MQGEKKSPELLRNLQMSPPIICESSTCHNDPDRRIFFFEMDPDRRNCGPHSKNTLIEQNTTGLSLSLPIGLLWLSPIALSRANPHRLRVMRVFSS